MGGGGTERERKEEGEGVGPGEEGKEWAIWALPLPPLKALFLCFW